MRRFSLKHGGHKGLETGYRNIACSWIDQLSRPVIDDPLWCTVPRLEASSTGVTCLQSAKLLKGVGMVDVDKVLDEAGLTNPHVREYVSYWAGVTGAEQIEVVSAAD